MSCSAQATKFCENDAAFFCDECDLTIHEPQDMKMMGGGKPGNPLMNDQIAKIMSMHKRVNVAERGRDYGMCSEHETRKNEFYCYCCQSAYCSECILTGLTKSDGKNHNLIKIEVAYTNALNEAKTIDVALEDKKVLIHD